MTIRSFGLALLAAGTLASCTNDEAFAPNEDTGASLYINDNTDDPQDHTSATSVFTATEGQLQAIFMGEPEGVEIINETMLDGTERQSVLLDGDVTMSVEQYKAFKESLTDEKQYRTFNLVTRSRNTINVVGFNANNGSGLTSRAQTGLRWAVDNWNRINTRFRFNLTFTTNWQSSDIVVYRVNNSSPGGRADFPSGGNPGRFVRINSGLDNSGNQIQEHVACHEIGHAMGMRHTNYFNRRGCSNAGNEGSGTDGAVHIPGTPTGEDAGSLMNACYPSNTQGEFSANDVRALEFLY